METSGKLYYSISEVAQMLNVNTSLIRFWEKEFTPLIKPKKNRNGKRMFTTSDIELLKQIYFLTKDKGYTLSGAKSFLKSSKKNIDSNILLTDTLKNIRSFLINLKEELDQE